MIIPQTDSICRDSHAMASTFLPYVLSGQENLTCRDMLLFSVVVYQPYAI